MAASVSGLQFQTVFQEKLVIELIGHGFLAQANERILLQFGEGKLLTAQRCEGFAPHKDFPEALQAHFLQGGSTRVGVVTTAKSISPFLTERMACGVEWL